MAATALGVKQIMDTPPEATKAMSKTIGTMGAGIAMLGATAAITGFLLGRIGKMFGDDGTAS